MSSILARLARLEESVSGSHARDEEETSSPLETGKEDINTNTTSRQESECPATSSSSRLQSSASKVLELEQTIISTQDLSSLVWARCPQFKGGDAWLPARLCDNAEGAAFRDIDFPIPTDKVLVEFFNLPKTIPRLTTVKRGAVHPFHRGPPTRCRHKEICEDVWSVDDMDRVKVLLKDKFNVSNAGRIYEAMTATATEFLRY